MADQIMSFRGTAGTVFTLVPGTQPTVGKYLVVTEIRLTNRHASSDAVGTVAVGTSDAANTTILQGLLKPAVAGTQGSLDNTCHTQVIAGEGLYIKASAASAVDYYISAVLCEV